jgi:proteic killer suppression protein
MEVKFRTRKLQRQYENHVEADRAYGEEVARRYIQRIELIKQVRDLDELKALPGLDCHPLRGDRKGHWAIRLTGFYRLIVSLQGDNLEIVQIEEVSKHYGD